MINKINTWIARLSPANINKAIMNGVRTREADIIKLNTESQLDKGVNTLGSKMTPAYTPYTKRLKKAAERNPKLVTYRDTGEMHKATKIVYSKQSFEIVNTNWKAAEAEKRSGKVIFGLTKPNILRMAEMVKHPITTNVRNLIIK